MWPWIHRAWLWFKRRPTRFENFFYIAGHSSIPKSFDTFLVPRGTKIIFKASVGNYTYANFGPSANNVDTWGVQVVNANQLCINHKLYLPKDEVFEDNVSNRVLRQPQREKPSRMLLHGVFKLPLPNFFDEFPTTRKKKLIEKLQNLSIEKQEITSLKSVVMRNGPGVYFVSCCRVIEVKGHCFQITSDIIESENQSICYKRTSHPKNKRVKNIENIYSKAVLVR